MASAARRKERTSGMKTRTTIGDAPKEPEVAVIAGDEKKTEATAKPVSEDEVLAQDFKALEDGASPSIIGDSLADMQRVFAVDGFETQAQVDEWNRNAGSWLDVTDAGRSYEMPFPSELVYYPEKPAKMRLRFDQEYFMLRQSHMLETQLELENFCHTLEIRSTNWRDRYADITADRKDAHVIVHSIKLCKRNTKLLPFSCEVKLLTGTSESDRMREWHTDDPEGHTVGNLGLVTGAVVEPEENSRDTPMLLYHASMERLTNPWMSRFMTCNFEKLRTEVMPAYLHGRNGNYYKIKAPPLRITNFKEIGIVQWLVFSFFRYLKFATQRQMAIDVDLDAKFAEQVGKNVIQKVTQDNYQFVIYKPALDRVITEIHKKVRPATHMANLEHIVLGLSLVGGKKTAQALSEKMALTRGQRDDLESNPIVGPMSFVVEIGYIAIPKEYQTMEMQTEASTGGPFKMFQSKKKTAGYGSHSYGAAVRS